MYIRLRTLNMIVQVMTEHVDQIYSVFPCGAFCYVSREQHESYVSDFVVDCGVRVLKLSRGLAVTEEHRRGSVGGSEPFFELLHEHFSDYNVVFVAKSSAEYYGDAICFGFDISGII